MKNTGGGRISDDGYVTTGYAARRLKVARETVRRWCLKGKIPGARQAVLASGWQVPESWVRALVEATRPRRAAA